jgi:hypothetical protein
LNPGEDNGKHYSVGDPGWVDSSVSDVVYMPSVYSRALPPFLIEIQKTVNEDFFLRLNQYALNLKRETKITPIVVVFNVGTVYGQDILCNLNQDDTYEYLYTVPSFPWASRCFFLSKESLHNNQTPNLNIMTIVGFFLTKKYRCISEHQPEHRNDPLMKFIYTIAFQKVDAQCSGGDPTALLSTVLEDIENKIMKMQESIQVNKEDTKEELCELFQSVKSYKIQADFNNTKNTMDIPESDLMKYKEYVLQYKVRCKADRTRFLWENCYMDGEKEGLFKEYIDYVKLNYAYNNTIKYL